MPVIIPARTHVTARRVGGFKRASGIAHRPGCNQVVLCARSETEAARVDCLPLRKLNGSFGLETTVESGAALGDSRVVRRLHEALRTSGGLVVVRGATELLPSQLVNLTAAFGPVEQNPGIDSQYLAPGYPEIQVIGNVRDSQGRLRAIFANSRPIEGDDIQYDPAKRAPVWHTDQLFRVPQPAGSILYCVEAPPEGADTCFADMAGAYAALPASEQERLRSLRVVCSYAHHNAKLKKSTPTYPLLTEAQRRQFPPVERAVVQAHPLHGALCLCGFNSSVCAVLGPQEALSPAALDRLELEGEEDPSVADQLYGTLLPHATSPQFTVRHRWRPGDLVIWDNRSTIHAASGFDAASYSREMWRTTFAPEPC